MKKHDVLRVSPSIGDERERGSAVARYVVVENVCARCTTTGRVCVCLPSSPHLLLILVSRMPRRPARYQFDCSPSEGAALVLPNGASRTNIRLRNDLQEHASRHGVSWFQHVYGSLRYGADAGSLYLITGYDQCDNWCVASYSDVAAEVGVSLSFTRLDSTSRGNVMYSAETSGAISARTFGSEDSGVANQCVFIRGYRMTLCESLIKNRPTESVTTSDIAAAPDNISKDIAGDAPGGALLGGLFSLFTREQYREDRGAQDRMNVEAVSVENFPDFAEAIVSLSQVSSSLRRILSSHIIH